MSRLPFCMKISCACKAWCESQYPTHRILHLSLTCPIPSSHFLTPNLSPPLSPLFPPPPSSLLLSYHSPPLTHVLSSCSVPRTMASSVSWQPLVATRTRYLVTFLGKEFSRSTACVQRERRQTNNNKGRVNKVKQIT